MTRLRTVNQGVCVVKEKIRLLAVKEALSLILVDVPDIEEGTEYDVWFNDLRGIFNRPESVKVCSDYIFMDDNELKDKIDEFADNTERAIRLGFGLMSDLINELGEAVKEGDPSIIAARLINVEQAIETAEIKKINYAHN
jgi:hypothetical protein